MAAKGPMMVARDFTPLGRISQCHKDAKLIRDMATRNSHGGLPMVARYLDVLENAEAAGESDLDNSGVLYAVERLARGH